jgi:hypothetical protein
MSTSTTKAVTSGRTGGASTKGVSLTEACAMAAVFVRRLFLFYTRRKKNSIHPDFKSRVLKRIRRGKTPRAKKNL